MNCHCTKCTSLFKWIAVEMYLSSTYKPNKVLLHHIYVSFYNSKVAWPLNALTYQINSNPLGHEFELEVFLSKST